MSNLKDPQIIEGLRERKNDVVSCVIEQNLPMVIYLIEHMGGNRQDAEDILQEALIILIKKVDSDEFKLTVRFSTYVYAVCKNLWLAKLKSKQSEEKRINQFVQNNSVSDDEEMEENNQWQKTVIHYFEQLSEVCRNIIQLYALGLTVEEIAYKLGNTENYIRKRKYECKIRLLDLIKNNGYKV